MHPAETPAGSGVPSRPELSVIIVSYNTRDLLAGCLLSLRRVSDEADFEVIVVDNASSDDSADMVRERFPEVILIEAGENLGFSAANNLGLAHSKGKFLFFLNPDAFVSRGTLVQLLSIARESPESSGGSPSPLAANRIAVLGATLINPDGTPQLSVLEFPNLWREFWNFLPELKRVLVAVRSGLNAMIPWPERRDLSPHRVGAVSGAAMMVRADAMREVGGFDEGFFLYHEERDLCYRLAAAGWEIWTVPTATVIHFDAQASGYRPNEFPREPILSYRILGMDRLYRMHRPGWQHTAWNFRSRNLLRLRALWRTFSGNRQGARELLDVVHRLKHPSPRRAGQAK